MRPIDADELAEEISGMSIFVGGRDIFPAEAKKSVLGRINEACTIEPQVVHGRWVWRCGIPYCSVCDNCPPGYDYDGHGDITTFCPSCGARMDAEGEEETT